MNWDGCKIPALCNYRPRATDTLVPTRFPMIAGNEGQDPHDDAVLQSTSQLPAMPPSILHKVFFGEDGLRAIWSLLIFVALLAALWLSMNAISNKLFPPTHWTDVIPLRLDIFIHEAIPFLATLLASWIMSKVERRPNSVYGLGGRRKVPHFFAGLAWGVVCLSLLVFTLWKTGLLVFDNRLLFGRDIFRYGAVWLFGFLIVGLLEEYLTRGYLQYTLTRGLADFYRRAFNTPHSAALGFWTSALVLSALFGLSHGSNLGESPIGLLTASLVAMVFCLSLWRTGALWWAIGFHTAWDWSESFLYGVRDSGFMVQHHLLATHAIGKPALSGGATGPEGSIFIIPILVLVILGILFTLPRTSKGYASNLSAHGLET